MLGWELWDVSHFIEVYSWQYSILCSDISRASSEPTCFFHVSTKSWFLISVFNETDLSEAGLFLMSTDYGDFCRDILYKWRIICHVQSDPSRVQDVIGLMSPYQVLCPKTESKSHSTWGVFLFQSKLGSSPRIRGFSSLTSTNVVNSIMTPKSTIFLFFFEIPDIRFAALLNPLTLPWAPKEYVFLAWFTIEVVLHLTACWLHLTASSGRAEKIIYIVIYIYTGWWFETLFIFHNIWDRFSHWLSYFSRWLLHHQPVYIYRQIYIYIYRWVVFFLAYPQVWFFFTILFMEMTLFSVRG